MKQSFVTTAAALLAALALAPAANAAVENADSAATDTTGFIFTDVKVVKTTPVRDQNKSGTCWAFSSTTFFEDEILRQSGKEVDLSEMFTVRHCYDDKAIRYVRRQGAANFTQGGSGFDVPYVWKTYGAMPEEAYRGLNYGEDKHVHGEMERMLKGCVNAAVANPNRRLSTAWRNALNGVLDAYLGEVPETFVYEGKTYTPKSFAESLPIKVDDYVAVTSFTHHPYYEPFILEVADNWLPGMFQNVKLDELKRIIDNAVENGYPIAWAADVSEPGFKWREGYANIPAEKNEADLEGTELSRWVTLSDSDREKERYKANGPVEEITVTPESRQDMFDRFETTDDHGMEIVGYATDQNGNRFYKVRNSWDTNQKYGGYIYVSEPYLLAKTMNIFVHKDAVPKDLLKKMNIR